jgi:hypothetical protein
MRLAINMRLFANTVAIAIAALALIEAIDGEITIAGILAVAAIGARWVATQW